MMRKFSLTLSLLLVVFVPVLVLGAGSSSADDRENGGTVKLLKTIGPFDDQTIAVFDISWVDPDTQLYYLADRTNNAIDVVDVKDSVRVKQIAKGQFKGFTGNNNTSGPNGVVTSGHWLFVTDAPKLVMGQPTGPTVVSIDLNTDQIVDGVSVGGADALRTDELAYDPKDGILLVVNNADTPPFATLIQVNTANGHLTVGKRIPFADATNGAEQPVWDRRTGRFYISIPEVNGPGDGSGPNGAVKKINPHTGEVEATFLVTFCQPAGLTVGPNNDLLLGCSETFTTPDSAGNRTHWDPAHPTPNPDPKQVIMNKLTGGTTDVRGVGGSDEVWFNRGDGRYYTASRNNPVTPALGVIDADSKTLIQVVPTVTPSDGGTAHSVAVDPHNNHAIVPLPANTRIPDCAKGCFGVYGVPNGEHGEGHERN